MKIDSRLTIVLVCICVLTLLCSCASNGESATVQNADEFQPVKEELPEEETHNTISLNGTQYPSDQEYLSVTLDAEDICILDEFSNLKSISLNGSVCYAAIREYIITHPDICVEFNVALYNGQIVDFNTDCIEVCDITDENVADTIDKLQICNNICTINIGSESEAAITWENIALIQQTFPGAAVEYRFTIDGKEFSTLDTQMILSQHKLDDNAEFLWDILPCMTRCTFLDMDSCGVDNEHMAQFRDAFPQMKVVWRVWFGEIYTCRTDVTRILASSEGNPISDWNSDGLYYCTDAVYVDIGHSELTDLSFLYNMPNVEVLIVACAPWKDSTPIGSLEKLEYLEILSTSCNDISSFSNLHNLKHLNLGNCHHITDISSLYNLTQLERLWIGCVTPVPEEQKNTIKELLPDCEINTTTYNHKSEGWCKDETAHNVPRYALLREQFGNYEQSAYAYSWTDILYSRSIDELTDEELLQIKP